MTVFTSNPSIIAVGLYMNVTNAYVFPVFPRSQLLSAVASRPSVSQVAGLEGVIGGLVYLSLSQQLRCRWNDINDPDDTDSC